MKFSYIQISQKANQILDRFLLYEARAEIWLSFWEIWRHQNFKFHSEINWPLAEPPLSGRGGGFIGETGFFPDIFCECCFRGKNSWNVGNLRNNCNLVTNSTILRKLWCLNCFLIFLPFLWILVLVTYSFASLHLYLKYFFDFCICLHFKKILRILLRFFSFLLRIILLSYSEKFQVKCN